jgi:hypothetical protein
MVELVKVQCVWKTVEVGGPMGGFLYEVDGMEGILRLGKLIVDEMEG